MSNKYVRWLYQQLPNLINQGVITGAAADKLRNYYGEVKTDKKWFVIILCGVLGALLIGLGVILLFAHNWENLSRSVRAVLSLLPLMSGQALALWVLLKRSQSDALRESSATFLSLMVGASIALIGQTYSIPNDTPAFILTWMLLIIPLVYFMQATIPTAMYVVGISSWSCCNWNDPLKSFLFWPLLVLAVPHLLWSLKQEKYTFRSAILAFITLTGVCVCAAPTLARIWPGSWIVIYSSLFTLFYLTGCWNFDGISTNWQAPLRLVGGLGIFVLMFVFTFRFPWESVRFAFSDGLSLSLIPGYLLTFTLIVSAALFFLEYFKRKDWMNVLFGALPIMVLVAYAGFAATGFSSPFPMFLFNIFLLILSIYRLTIGLRSNNLGIINTGMIMLAVLVLARFFDTGINFIAKGFVFILIGTGFLFTNVVILRRKGSAA